MAQSVFPHPMVDACFGKPLMMTRDLHALSGTQTLTAPAQFVIQTLTAPAQFLRSLHRKQRNARQCWATCRRLTESKTRADKTRILLQKDDKTAFCCKRMIRAKTGGQGRIFGKRMSESHSRLNFTFEVDWSQLNKSVCQHMMCMAHCDMVNLMEKIGLKAPGNYVGWFWFNNFLICLFENPKTFISMISGFGDVCPALRTNFYKKDPWAIFETYCFCK